MEPIRWAIVGTGYIANEFACGMQEVDDAKLAAVVSRKEETAKSFAEKYHADTYYSDFTLMLAQEEIDVVYLGIPNDCHYAYIMEALEAGVNVLSEKPIVDNCAQLGDVITKARKKDLFLMEGMWTRCFPAVIQARKWIEEDRIGEIESIHAGFDIKPDKDDWQTWKAGIAHAGGSLRDVGIYSLAMAYLAFPQGPDQVDATMQYNGEVDESFHMMLCYEDGKAAFVSGAFNQVSSPLAEIVGDEGRIVIGPEFWHPTTATLIMNDGTEEEFTEEYPASGFQYEIREVQQCIRGGMKECPLYTLEETVRIADLIERTRKQWGIIYESDNMGA